MNVLMLLNTWHALLTCRLESWHVHFWQLHMIRTNHVLFWTWPGRLQTAAATTLPVGVRGFGCFGRAARLKLQAPNKIRTNQMRGLLIFQNLQIACKERQLLVILGCCLLARTYLLPIDMGCTSHPVWTRPWHTMLVGDEKGEECGFQIVFCIHVFCGCTPSRHSLTL